MIGFQTLSFPSLNLSRTNLQPKTYFSSKPHQFQVYYCKLSSRYEFLILSFIIFLRLCRNFSLGFWNLGVFKNWVGVCSFVQFFFKSLIGLSPICYLCICVGPLRHFKGVLRHFLICSCIVHNSYASLLVRCLTKCPSDIFVLNWIQVNSNFWVSICLKLFHLFWYLSMCFTHFAHVAHTRHTLGPSKHISCITCCTHMHQHMLSTDTHMHSYLIHALCLCLLGLTP